MKLNRRFLVCLPLVFFLLLCLLLWYALSVNPRRLQSTKIGNLLPVGQLVRLDTNAPMSARTAVKGRISLVNIWASWCAGCRIEHPIWAYIHHEMPDINLIGIAYKDQSSAANQWLSRYGNPYRNVLLDLDGQYCLDLGVYGTPETFIVDQYGIIRGRHVGLLSKQTWREVIKPKIMALQKNQRQIIKPKIMALQNNQ